MKRMFICITLLTINSVLLSAQDNNTFSLRQCIETAMKNNNDVKQSELQMQSAGVYSSQAKTDLLPVLSGDITH